MEESIRVRLAAVPVELVDLAKKLKEEVEGEERRWELPAARKWDVAEEILGRLKELGADAKESQQRAAVESWRSEKLEQIKWAATGNMTSNSSIPAQEAKMLEGALQSDWFNLLEDIGFWMPANVNNSEINDKPENAQELEDREVIAGPPLPPECHAELHTDYDGAAVRWGLTHHKESAADCCQACLDHAKNAKEGEKKCNIWVYCPSEFGCYSPDIYEHKHQECCLNQGKNSSTGPPSMILKGDNSVRKTHYDVLAVKQDASYAEIRASYKAAILNSHPDKLLKASEFGVKFLDVQKAWEVLSDSKARSNYDKELLVSAPEVDVVADEVGLEEMSVETDNDLEELSYRCRCGDYYLITSTELGEMGFLLSKNGGVTSVEPTADVASACVLLPCGSCSLKIKLVIDLNC